MNKVLIIGSGGREHALAWKLVSDVEVGKVYCLPGNGGTQNIACNVDLKICSLPFSISIAIKEEIKYPDTKTEKSNTGSINNAYLIPNLFITYPDIVIWIINDANEAIE